MITRAMKTATLTTLLLGFVLAAACGRKHHEDESIPDPQPHVMGDEEGTGEDVNNTVPDETKDDKKKGVIHQATDSKTDTTLVTDKDALPKPNDAATCNDVTITHTSTTVVTNTTTHTATALTTATDTSSPTLDWDLTCIPPRG